MESEFEKMRKEQIKVHKNIMSLEIIIYIVTVFIMFGLGGKIADLATMRIPLMSIDGIIKIVAMICLFIIVAIVFILGPIIVLRDIATYFKNKD